MKAWRVNELGEPKEVLRLEEVADPTAGPGQLLVKVLAAPANFPDVLLCRGEYQIKPPLPFTPGVELCGEVVEIGDGVTRFAVGDRVVGNPELPSGSFAELTVMAEENAYPAPDSLDDAEASALSIGYQTSWFALHRRTQLQPGETLLVHAAAGGVGSTAVQLGKAAGATVIGVVAVRRRLSIADSWEQTWPSTAEARTSSQSSTNTRMGVAPMSYTTRSAAIPT